MENVMGNRIKQMRLLNDLTQKELADKLGVKTAAVNKWESGAVQNIKRSTIQHMSKIFNVDPVWLMGLDVSLVLDNVTIEPNNPHHPITSTAISGPCVGANIIDKSLSSEEQYIIAKYRSLSPSLKKKVIIYFMELGES